MRLCRNAVGPKGIVEAHAQHAIRDSELDLSESATLLCSPARLRCSTPLIEPPAGCEDARQLELLSWISDYASSVRVDPGVALRTAAGCKLFQNAGVPSDPNDNYTRGLLE